MIFIIKTESQQKSDKAKISATTYTSPASATYTKKLSFSKPQLTTDRYEGTIEWGPRIVSLSTIDKNPKDRFKNLHFFLKFRIYFWKRIQISIFFVTVWWSQYLGTLLNLYEFCFFAQIYLWITIRFRRSFDLWIYHFCFFILKEFKSE